MVAANQLEEAATNDIERAHLLAARDKESAAWLHALPISDLGLRLDNDSLRIAVGIQLSSSLCPSTMFALWE